MEYFIRKGHYRTRKDGTQIYVKPMQVRKTRRRTSSITKQTYPRYIRASMIRTQRRLFGNDYWKTSLGRYGYKNIKNKTTRQRHIALANASRKLGYKVVLERMKKTVKYMRNKNSKRKTRVFDILKNDYEWLNNATI